MENEELDDEFLIDPEMLYGMRVNDDEVRLYINEHTTFVISQDAVRALYDELEKFL